MTRGSRSPFDEERPTLSGSDPGPAGSLANHAIGSGAPRASPRRPTVLVVEDDGDVQSTLADVLGFEGYEVLKADDGLEALELLRQHEGEPLLVLLDMMMPRMNGEQFLRAMRAESRVPDMPVVVLSAMTHRNEAIEGARVCLHKPISYAALMSVVASLCPQPPPPSSQSGLRAAG
jgi:CheY-like chemotaxis protein